jgi:hypothetical protein
VSERRLLSTCHSSCAIGMASEHTLIDLPKLLRLHHLVVVVGVGQLWWTAVPCLLLQMADWGTMQSPASDSPEAPHD